MARVSNQGSYPPPSAYPPPEGAAVRTRRPVDVAVTIVLIVVMAGLGVLSMVLGLFFTMASDGCFGDETCYDRVGIGVLILEAAPVIAWVSTTIWATRRLARGARAFWVPLVALPIWLAVVIVGFTVLGSA